MHVDIYSIVSSQRARRRVATVVAAGECLKVLYASPEDESYIRQRIAAAGTTSLEDLRSVFTTPSARATPVHDLASCPFASGELSPIGPAQPESDIERSLAALR